VTIRLKRATAGALLITQRVAARIIDA